VTGGGLRLVVLDNDPAVLELLALDMRLEGHEIIASVQTGEDAVRVCAEMQPDVLVADLRLGPGIDGLEVARQTAGLGHRVVLHTNYISRAIVEAAKAAGATVVEKGSLSALRRAIRG
jgi:CheY-like chemotaxis protein